MITEHWIISLLSGDPIAAELVHDEAAGGQPWRARARVAGHDVEATGLLREDALGQMCGTVGLHDGIVVRVRPRVAWTCDGDGDLARNGDFLLRVVPVGAEYRAYVIDRGMPTRIDTLATRDGAKAWAETALYEQLARRAGR